MAETLRELVVALSLDSSNFSRNMRTINQQIKEAESTFRLAGAVWPGLAYRIMKRSSRARKPSCLCWGRSSPGSE